MLLNIVSCYGFFQEENPKVILTCRIKLMSYYLSERFVMIVHDYQDLKNISNRVKQLIHEVGMHVNDLEMTCNAMIPSADNTMKKINLSAIILNKFTSTYEEDKKYGFEIFFKQFIENFIDNIYHPE